MANLSNINGYFNVTDTGLVNVVNGGLYVTKTSGDAIVGIISSGGNGKPYYLRSKTDGSFVIYDDNACLERLNISSGGNATFSKLVGVGGKTPAYGLSLAQGTAAENKIAWTDGTPTFAASIYANNSNDKLTFATKNASNAETVALEIDTSQNAAFAANITASDITAGGDLIGGQVDGQWLFTADVSAYEVIIDGDLHVDKKILDSSGDAGTSGQILSSTGTGTNWINNNTGDIGGSGTANKVAKFTAASTIGDGPITFSGNNSTFAGTVTFNDHTYHPDQVKSIFGTGSDAEIQFNGSHLFIDNTVGTTYLRNTGTGGSGFIFRNSNIGDFEFDNEFAGNIKFNTSNIERMRIDSSGNVGIGTITPQKALHIEGASGASASQLLVCGPSDTIGDTAGILLRAEGGEADSALRAKGGIFFEREAANGLGKLHLCNNNSNNNDSATLADAALTITQDKKVGIGTTSPQNKFVVANGTGNTQNIEIAPNYIQSFNRQSGNLGYATMDFYASNYTFNVSDVLIGTHGKFLQGRRSTSSTVIDMIGFGAGTDNLQIKGGTSGAANAISFYDTGGFLGTWYNGNFGIAIGTPQAKLQVNGAVNTFSAHFGGQNNTNGQFQGISLGYAEGANAAYRKVAIVTQAKGDGAARQDLHFLVDTVSDSNSAGIADSKMSIRYDTGNVSVSNFLGVGLTQPAYKFQVYEPVDRPLTSSQAQMRIDGNGYSAFFALDGDSFQIGQNSNYRDLTFHSGASSADILERMRIKSHGDVCIGGTSTQNARTASFDVGTNIVVFDNCTTSGAGNGAEFQTFRRNNGTNSVQIGSIVMNGTSGVTYATTSDYRLKENVVELTNALDRIDQLKPSRFNFISDEGRTIDGFLAHEVQDIVPEAVVGTKDGVDENGNPKYQSIDQSKLVPLLVGAIKELKAEIKQLQTQINK